MISKRGGVMTRETTINIQPDGEGTKDWILHVAKSDLPMAVRLAVHMENTPWAISMSELAQAIDGYGGGTRLTDDGEVDPNHDGDNLPYREWGETEVDNG